MSDDSVATATPRQTGIITFLLDRSWSMRQIQAATLEGFNGYLGDLKEKSDADLLFTLVIFDDQSIDPIHVSEPVADVPFLTEETYVPRGGTPLIEAAIKTILALREALKKRTDKPRVSMCIQTDGHENSSGAEYTAQALKELIAECEKDGWEFNYLGSGVDVYASAHAYGIRADNTMSYDAHDLGATKSAFAATARNAGLYASGAVANSSYSTQDRSAAQDAYWDKHSAVSPQPLTETPKPTARPTAPRVVRRPPQRGSTLGSIDL